VQLSDTLKLTVDIVPVWSELEGKGEAPPDYMHLLTLKPVILAFALVALARRLPLTRLTPPRNRAGHGDCAIG
jgi:hypothetical protein